jgi:hypothetical protein
METGIAAALIGGLGILIGLVVDRLIQRAGKLHFVISDFTWEPEEQSHEYTFYIKVFNEREVGTGVRDVDVRFLKGETKVEDRPVDTWSGEQTDYLNFPSRAWVVKKLRAGQIKSRPEQLEDAKECSEAQLVVRHTGRKEAVVDMPGAVRHGEEDRGSVGWIWPWR